MFVKFPHTPHLTWLATGHPRDDKVLLPDEASRFLKGEIVIEEKVDGANVGFSVVGGVVVAQGRGEYLRAGSHPQFSALWPWLARHRQGLLGELGDSLTLFGEWCYAVHSVFYKWLPDWFLGFDVYDQRTRRFWSVARRNQLLASIGLCAVPELGQGHYSLEALKALATEERSHLGPAAIEGLYLRSESDGWLNHRAKLVRPEFVQSIGKHWSKRSIERNSVLAQPSS